MKKYLEFEDEKSKKFWEVTVTQNDYTVRYGKCGSKGTSKTKPYASFEEATKEIDKLVTSKVKKGYKDPTMDYTPLLECTDIDELQKLLCDHFAFLVDYPGYEAVLKEVMKDAHGVKMDGKDLVVEFRGEKVLYAAPPADLLEYKKYPNSYKKCAVVHEYMSFPEQGYSLNFGDVGAYESVYLENADSEILKTMKAKDVICAISDDSDWWLYNPGQKNVLGEPGLCLLSHDGGDVADAEMIPIGSLLLKQMAELQNINIEFPEPVMVDNDPMTWWESLSENWQKALCESADIDEDTTINEKIVATILKMKKFRFHEDSCDLETLEPLVAFEKLDEISMSRQPTITTLDTISSCEKIYYISISGSPIENLNALATMKKLQFLDLEDSLVEDLSPLSKLTKLERVNVKNSHVTNLKPLAKLKNIRELNLSGSKISSLESLPHFESLSGFDISDTAITDLTPLKQYTRLGSVDVSRTDITDLSALHDVGDIFTFSCKQSKISFKELLRFLSPRYEKITADRLPLTVYSESMMRPNIFSEELSLLDEIPEEAGDIASFYVNQFVVHFYKQQKITEAMDLLKTFVKLKPKNISKKPVQEFISNCIPALMQANEIELEKELFALLPEKLSISTLAFNLCCMYATRNDKENMLKYATDALMLNHDPQKFRTDSDLESFQDDPDFIAILTGPKSVDPRVDPAGWWNPMTSDWKFLMRDAVDEISCKEDIIKVTAIEELEVYEPTTLEPLRYLTGLKKLKIEYSLTTDLEPLAGLINLEELILENSEIDKTAFADISPLAKLTNLKVLAIVEHEVSDLSVLKNMNQLEELRMVRLPITSIEALSGSTKLRKVKLQLMKFSDITPLKDNHNMTSLMLYSSDVEDISIVSNMKSLYEINVSSTKVSDISALATCKELGEVQLTGCPVTTLQPIEKLTELIDITVYDTAIPKEELEAFKKAHPKCEISM